MFLNKKTLYFLLHNFEIISLHFSSCPVERIGKNNPSQRRCSARNHPILAGQKRYTPLNLFNNVSRAAKITPGKHQPAGSARGMKVFSPFWWRYGRMDASFLFVFSSLDFGVALNWCVWNLGRSRTTRWHRQKPKMHWSSRASLTRELWEEVGAGHSHRLGSRRDSRENKPCLKIMY